MRKTPPHRGLLAVVLSCGVAAPAYAQLPVPTTLEDFFLEGSQPNSQTNPIVMEPFVGVMEGNCANCHADFDLQYLQAEPFSHWAGSMMAQATRDILFRATMVVANQDAEFVGDLCLRCHTPAGWLGGRSLPVDGSSLSEPADFEGMTCHFCHRMVDPVYTAGVSPAEDASILDDLDALGLVPQQYGDGRYVADPDDRVRRGPRDPNVDGINHPQGADALYSPFHSETAFCATCHDVSNPVFVRQPDGTYQPGTLGAPHPTGDKRDMFPVERTYSEWTESQFAAGGVDLGGRFGGNHATGIMATCQDCHMPDQVGPGCRNSGLVRQDAPQHALNGGSGWVLAAVRTMDVDGDNQPDWPDSVTGLTDEIVEGARDRAVQLLRDASDLELSVDGSTLTVRVTNWSGHKLPSGYPEGRRMWLNVQFLDEADVICDERGHYDFTTGVLTTTDTKVYETKLGLDDTMAGITGLPAGESFHFALNNVILKDNRIPPVGFTNERFDLVQAAPVDYAYEDEQHWDDTAFDIPPCARAAVVTLYYQSTSKEYVEFLRDTNVTDNLGQVVYDEWVLHGRSAPVDMDTAAIELAEECPWDCGDGNGTVETVDFLALLAQWGQTDVPCDFDGAGVDTVDFLALLANWGPCPGGS